jgi:hypothetical protein
MGGGLWYSRISATGDPHGATFLQASPTYDELRGMFGTHMADVVIEVTGVKFLAEDSRKRL